MQERYRDRGCVAGLPVGTEPNGDTMLTYSVKGRFPKAGVQPPYELFGTFFSSVVGPSRLQNLKRAVDSISSGEQDHVEYTHDYTWLDLDRQAMTATVTVDHPVDDVSQEATMPLHLFCSLAAEWIQFAEQHLPGSTHDRS